MKTAKEIEQGGQEVRDLSSLTELVIGAAIEVHRQLGPGLLESVYEVCLYAELTSMKIEVQRQVVVPITYKGIVLKDGLRLDLLVDNRLVVEIKAVESLHPVHSAQVITYLKLARLPSGLLLNFNVSALRQGIKRLYATGGTKAISP